ncbi:hypothetical protein SKAU_G00234160 [Synaphobranchus kaupii]|uniref:Retropepsins domain-containing protein n=1 Tax=Synaphobranchus kaupii TaxID=118154 RepID=A0A9Q1ISN3_SYNKA|nr:hypothetical protein SKAU_G00234160 [Synaphobranchus kaupii]
MADESSELVFKSSLESYLAQLELAAQSGWTPEQTAGHLALALEGPALEAILDLPPTERQNLQALTAALQLAVHPAPLRRSKPGKAAKLLPLTSGWPTARRSSGHARHYNGQWGDKAGAYRTRLPSSSTKATEAPAVGETRQGRRSEENAAPGTNPPQPGRLGKASGLYLHCRLDGQACRALVDTGATISLVRPGVLHNTGGPQLPGAWTPTATPLTSVTGAKMAMRGKKEVKVTVSGQEVSHEFWLADIADSCIIGLDLLKRWGACVDVSRASITLGMETVALQSGPMSTPPSHHSPASKQATPARHRTQATVTDHSAPAQTSSACRDDSSCPRPVATKQQRARPPAAQKPPGRKRRPFRGAG